jgi:hypothetical protein
VDRHLEEGPELPQEEESQRLHVADRDGSKQEIVTALPTVIEGMQFDRAVTPVCDRVA